MSRDNRHGPARDERRRPPAWGVAAMVVLGLLIAATPAFGATDGKLRFLRNATTPFASNVVAAQGDPALQ